VALRALCCAASALLVGSGVALVSGSSEAGFAVGGVYFLALGAAFTLFPARDGDRRLTPR
jgi:hypothetical protein